MEANDVRLRTGGDEREDEGTTKYEECNVLLPPVRYTFHRISLGHVRWNNKDKDAAERKTGHKIHRGL